MKIISRKSTLAKIQARLVADKIKETKGLLKKNRLLTVCEEAMCPNLHDCWSKSHATFMILGDTCTRSCSFCNIKTGKPSPIDPLEPIRIAEAMNRIDRVDISVDVKGGGQMGQVDAIRTAIARGLVKYNDGAEGDDEELRDEFVRFERKILVNDPRRKEPKHQMGRGARKKWQKSYR